MTARLLEKTYRCTLRRMRERGNHDRNVAYSILDEGLLCHVGFSMDSSTFVVPMAYARVRDHLCLHGAAGNRMLRALAAGTEACVTVTLLDGLVLARSAFHHSMNYRSVMLFGRPERVDDDDEKREIATALLDHIAPGRSVDARAPNEAELTSTLFIRFAISEGSAKVRTGGPLDDPEDLELPIWAGQIPLKVMAGAPISEENLPNGVAVPEYGVHYPDRSRRPA